MNIQTATQRTQEMLDAMAFSDPALNWTPAEAWYAACTRPGAQRSPSFVGDLPAKRNADSIVERNLKKAGIEFYMPCYRRDVIHHRTRKWIDRRFPMFVGYVFVNLPKSNFSEVEAIDGITHFVRPGNNRYEYPLLFPEGIIGRLRLVEFELEQSFLHQRIYRQRRQELWDKIGKQKPSKAEMKALFEKGRRVYLNPKSPFAGMNASVLSVTARGTIRTIVETLEKTIKVDIPLEHINDVE